MEGKRRGLRVSKLLLPSGDDHPDAAGKHLQDAKVLATGGRPDGAVYLSGYVVECAMKSVILLQSPALKANHDINGLSNHAALLAALPGSRSAKYARQRPMKHAMYSGANRWRAGIRYWAPGRFQASEAAAFIAEAEEVYKSTIAEMRLDGVV